MSTSASSLGPLVIPFLLGVVATAYWFVVVATERRGAGLGTGSDTIDDQWPEE